MRVAMTHIFRRSFGFFLCLLYSSSLMAGPVVPGQSQWCITKRIASSVDAAESMINIIYGEISASQAILTSELNVLGSTINLIESDAGVIASEIALLDSCQPTPFTASTTISLAGFYCLSANNTVGTITVQAATNNVVVDLNGHRVQGVVIQNNNQILFRNGTIIASNMTGFGVDVQSGSRNITLRNIDVQNAQVGIRMSGVANGLIDSCSMSLNFTGVQLNQCQNIVVNNTVAWSDQDAGFDLISSTTCTLADCKALSTGQGNTNVINNSVVGFSSLNGSANVFERCIANSTQALSTTDFSSIVAGFALRGTESCSKIIACESSNVSTSPSGVTIPYGILLQAQFSGLVTVTAANPESGSQTVFSRAWSPDGTYLAVGGEAYATPIGFLAIYTFNYVTQSLTEIIVQNITGDTQVTMNAVAWSPDGNYLVAGGFGSAGAVFYLYSFDRDNQKISLLQTISFGSSPDEVNALSWSPNGRYVAVGASTATANDFYVYNFNPIAQTLTAIYSSFFALAGEKVNTVEWSPDGNYLVAGGQLTTTTPNFSVYSFNTGNTPVLTQVGIPVSPGAGGTMVETIAWSPDGKYLAVIGTFTPHLLVYSFSGATPVLVASTNSAVTLAVTWSPDGTYIAAAGATGIFVYTFNRGTNQLILNGSTATNTVFNIAWSPDGQYLAAGGQTFNGFTLYIYQLLTFPNSNLINNNVVYCNSGGSIPSGIGISGSSIANMIIQNTAYSNPIAPFMVDTSYAFIPNVFNQNFGDAPTLLQNIVMGYRQPIAQQANLGLIARQILNQVVTVVGCSPTTLTSANVSGGTISLTASGNYCLGAPVTSDIAITGTSVALNLNNNCLTGDIIITGDDATVYNGTVVSPVVATTTALNAGIDILTGSNRAIIHDLVVDASSTTTIMNVGRPALRTAGIDTQVYNCTLTGGPASGADGTSSNGMVGGSGLVLTGAATRAVITNCTIIGGNGGNGGSSSPFGNGGNGGHGIQVQAGSVSLVEINGCVIAGTGAGGAPGSTNGSVTGGRGGDGINIDISASGVAVHNCIIRNTGAAGLSATQTLVTALAPMISVIDTADGKAINDFVTSTANLSVAFGNFADTIKNPIVYNLNNRQATPGTDPTNGDGGVLVSNPPDTPGGGNVITNHMVNVFMSVVS